MTEKMRKPRADSKMYQLPKEALNQIDDMLLNENMKYSDIRHWIEQEYGMKISLSSISNYAVKVYAAAQRVSDDLKRTQFYVDYLKDQEAVDTDKITTAILKSGLLQKLATAEEDFNEMSVEKAGKLVLELQRIDLARERLEFDYKKKMQLAFEQLEKDLMLQLMKYPVLREQFSNLLKQYKSKLFEEKQEDYNDQNF